MSNPLPSVLRRDSELADRARPLIEEARILKPRVVDRLERIDAEIGALRREAEEELEEARCRAETIRQEAREAGRKEGLEECMRKLAKARAEYSRLRDQGEQEMVELAFHIARRLVGKAIEMQPEIVRDIVGEALVNARGHDQIVVLIHPDDHDRVEAARDEYVRALEGVPVYFEADPSLERGGCVIETESGRIDARLETQLQVLREALLDGRLDH